VINKLMEIIRTAGAMALEDYYSLATEIEFKGNIDLVTKTDLRIEEYLKQQISSLHPGHDFLIEETDNELKDSNNLWIIDPLDGTTNFSHRFPLFAISIAYEKNKEIILGITYIPYLKELFWAEKGKGAFLNGRKIYTSVTSDISTSLIATGFPYDRWQEGDLYLKEFAAFMKKCQGIRRAGAAVIDLCYTACGRLDGFFERKLKPWDTAAGSLILQEAGGLVTDYSGKPRHYSDSTIIASNKKLHSEMQKILADLKEK